VDIERLDGLMNTVGELVVDRTRLGELTRVLQSRYGHDDLVRDLCDTSAHLVRMVEELNDGMCSVRMVPIATLFATFPRLVRDLARQTGKDIEFTIDGEETELDRAVIDQIRDALVHVLRNAVDHGIEPPAERRAAGKAPAGTVRVAAHHEGGRIVVSVQDDGRGIDPQLVRSRAVEQGIVSAQAAGRMSDREGIELVYESGLSTSDEVTQTSGRGVGMDVVRRSVSGVGGLIDIESAPGLGTTVTLRLPLTLATFEALLVRSRATVFAIPLGYVQETAKLRPGVADTIMGAEVLRLRDEVMPLVRLGDGGGDERPETNGQGAVVIVRAGERALALAVDALLDQREVVAKPLQAIGSCEGISGTSVLGDGSVALILDTGALIARAAREHGEVELGGTSA
ncbi:MAG: chemotaxis protein CheA, partial [Dehalococcoidia bacterium]